MSDDIKDGQEQGEPSPSFKAYEAIPIIASVLICGGTAAGLMIYIASIL